MSGSVFIITAIAASGAAAFSMIARLSARTRPATAFGFSFKSFCETMMPFE